MDYSSHWATVCKCSGCGEEPETGPLYHCPFQHQYCSSCYHQLRKQYHGSMEDGCTCRVCNASGKFQQSKINTDFLRKLKIKPGIGRPFRYSSNPFHSQQRRHVKTDLEQSSIQRIIASDAKVTVEDLFQMPSNDVQHLLNKNRKSKSPTGSGNKVAAASRKASINNCRLYDIKEEDDFAPMKAKSRMYFPMQMYSTSTIASKKPIQCPHKTCGKMVTSSAFVSHFRYEHNNIQKFTVGRGKDLVIPFDASIIEDDTDHCIAMIAVYEMNKIDLGRSKSTQSVIKTCNRFNKQIPVDTFWLMVSGLIVGRTSSTELCAYTAFWLFTSSDDSYRCTIELASKNDKSSITTFCNVQTANNYYTNSANTFGFLTDSLNCMLFCESAIMGLLQEGPELNLRIVIH